MKFVVIVSCLVLYSFGSIETLKLIFDDEEGGYYWRDYIGKIPRDAVRGGKNRNRNATYIGQVKHSELLIPGYIDIDSINLVYEFKDLMKKAVKHVKILCTRHPENFEWIPTSNNEIGQIEGVELVNGGFEPDANTYIGRTIKDGQVLIGKVLVTELGFTGLHLGAGGSAHHFNEYEVLAYRKPATPTGIVEHVIKIDNSNFPNSDVCTQSISINIH